MKIAFISDIHSNIEAFQSVLTFLKKKEIDHIYIAGDLIGYYYYGDEVLNICMRHDNISCIRGNHDRNFLASLSDESLMTLLTDKYGSALSRTKEKLTQAQINWLSALPSKLTTVVDDIKITIAHGCLENDTTYIYPDASFETLKQQTLNSDVTVLGHTHYQHIWCYNNKYLLNPGSVGQPRDQGSLAGILVLDTSNRAIIPYRVKFDFKRLKEDILKYDKNNEYLLKVLER